jgi:hypothetical protein
MKGRTSSKNERQGKEQKKVISDLNLTANFLMIF